MADSDTRAEGAGAVVGKSDVREGSLSGEGGVDLPVLGRKRRGRRLAGGQAGGCEGSQKGDAVRVSDGGIIPRRLSE